VSHPFGILGAIWCHSDRNHDCFSFACQRERC
jgi:hypothetical protein